MDQQRIAELAHLNLIGVFGERDPQKRAAVIEQIYAEQVSFADPDEVVVGRAALDAKAQHLLDGAPGFVFSHAGPLRIVQDLAIQAWHFGPEGAPPVVSGTDILLVEDGRIARLYTVLDPPA